MAKVNQPGLAVVLLSCLQLCATHPRLNIETAAAAVKVSASLCVQQPAKAVDGSFHSLRFLRP